MSEKIFSEIFSTFLTHFIGQGLHFITSKNIAEAVFWRRFLKKVFLEISQNSQENTWARVSFLIKLQALAYNVIKKETITQVFSYEFCEIFKNTFFI